MSVIGKKHISKGISYQAYCDLMDQLVDEGRTTGPNQSESMLHYTKMNRTRMRRLNRTTKLLPATIEAMEKIKTPQIWLILTEAWCGDAAQNIPVIQKMAELNSNIEVNLIFRDNHLDVMDAYLTNGGRSIPKLIMLRKADLSEIGTWGPRPAPVQKMVMDFRESGGDYSKFSEKAQVWYNQDRTETLQREMIGVIGD
jgi:hypothetical protein